MPRPIIGGTSVPRPSLFAPARTAPVAGSLQGPQLQARLRQSRSKAYVEAIARLDAGVHHADEAALRQLLEAIAAEFPELTLEQHPLGLLSRCYLGAPYEVHICDLAGAIIEHFETFRVMPGNYERARNLAKHPRYAFIEIYADSVRAIAEDGSVSVVQS